MVNIVDKTVKEELLSNRVVGRLYLLAYSPYPTETELKETLRC